MMAQEIVNGTYQVDYTSFRGDVIVCCGGYEGRFEMDAVEAFCLNTGTWADLPPMPVECNSLAAGAYGSVLIAAGGSAKWGQKFLFFHRYPKLTSGNALLRDKNIINKGMYGYLSGRALGIKNSNKNTSEFLTLCPCLNLWCFRSIFGRYNEQRQN